MIHHRWIVNLIIMPGGAIGAPPPYVLHSSARRLLESSAVVFCAACECNFPLLCMSITTLPLSCFMCLHSSAILDSIHVLLFLVPSCVWLCPFSCTQLCVALPFLLYPAVCGSAPSLEPSCVCGSAFFYWYPTVCSHAPSVEPKSLLPPTSVYQTLWCPLGHSPLMVYGCM